MNLEPDFARLATWLSRRDALYTRLKQAFAGRHDPNIDLLTDELIEADEAILCANRAIDKATAGGETQETDQ